MGVTKRKTKTISFNVELQERLDKAVEELNKRQITGAVTQSKIIRIALAQYLEKLSKIQMINEEYDTKNANTIA